MNTHKLQDIINMIRGLDKLPTDPYGQRLSVDELMNWFGLTESLTRLEQIEMKSELSLIIEAELFAERLKQAEQMYDFS